MKSNVVKKIEADYLTFATDQELCEQIHDWQNYLVELSNPTKEIGMFEKISAYDRLIDKLKFTHEKLAELNAEYDRRGLR